MQFKDIQIDQAQIKFAADGSINTFSGYACVFGGIDSYGDTIHPGAFKSAIGDGAEVKMYFNHGWLRRELPIGKMQVREDRIGLYVEHAEFTKGMSMADDVALAVKHKTVSGLSIGFKPAADGIKRKASGKGHDIYSIELLKEVSVVDWPADQSAQIMDMKSAIEEAETIREIEAILRDAGWLSRSDARALVSRIKSLALWDKAPKNNPATIRERILLMV